MSGMEKALFNLKVFTALDWNHNNDDLRSVVHGQAAAEAGQEVQQGGSPGKGKAQEGITH